MLGTANYANDRWHWCRRTIPHSLPARTGSWSSSPLSHARIYAAELGSCLIKLAYMSHAV
jgi:hypothetical protein